MATYPALEAVAADIGRHAPDGVVLLTTADITDRRLNGVRASLIACGHNHVPRHVCLADVNIINLGSVGLQAYCDDKPPHRVENGLPHARYAPAQRHAWLTDPLYKRTLCTSSGRHES